jgi:hypothetical protein
MKNNWRIMKYGLHMILHVTCGKPNNKPSLKNHHFYGWFLYHPQMLGLQSLGFATRMQPLPPPDPEDNWEMSSCVGGPKGADGCYGSIEISAVNWWYFQ